MVFVVVGMYDGRLF